MTVTPLQTNGNSSKFLVSAKHGDFTIALSYTLRTRKWNLESSERELAVATELASAIVSRHDMAFPFHKVYVFAEHNSEATAEASVLQIRKKGFVLKTDEDQ